MVTLGALLVSFGLEIFLVPNNIIDGGIVGISIIMSYLTGIKLELFLLILNVPFLYLGYRQIGKKFVVTTLFGLSVLSLGTLFLLNVPVPTENPLLASIFGGAFLGVGVGMVIRSGGSLDGTEICFQINFLFNDIKSLLIILKYSLAAKRTKVGWTDIFNCLNILSKHTAKVLEYGTKIAKNEIPDNIIPIWTD